MATVIVNPDLSANPNTITIKGGETVTWESDQDFQIHLPAPYTNPNIGHNGAKWGGTSNPFPGKAAKYTVHYTITRGNLAHDPDIEIQP
jgi:plastocyanin